MRMATVALRYVVRATEGAAWVTYSREDALKLAVFHHGRAAVIVARARRAGLAAARALRRGLRGRRDEEATALRAQATEGRRSALAAYREAGKLGQPPRPVLGLTASERRAAVFRLGQDVVRQVRAAGRRALRGGR